MSKKVISNEALITEIERLIKEGSQVSFTPKGVSMHPFIRGGKDTVLLDKPERIQKGDIALARVAPATYVLHRVTSTTEDSIILVGDGNTVSMERCRHEDVIAVVTTIIKDGKPIDCHSRSHLRNAAIWRMLKPVRRYLLAIYRRIIL
ncbi:MAG: S24/S26 family peptidase [Bacteroidales bacterium]|nr:S24/S26 family peptidase [Bacteroidales bacterium]